MTAVLLTLASVLVLVTGIRYAFIRQSVHGRVDHHYWLQAAAAFRRQRRLPFALDGRYLLEDRLQSYPPLFAAFLSLFPDRFLRRRAVAVSQTADAICAALGFCAMSLLGVPWLLAASAILLFLLSPVLVAYNIQVNPRAWGNLFLAAKLLAEAAAGSGAGDWLWGLAIVATALVFLTHKMTTQLMLFLWLPWAFSLSSWWAVASVPLGLGASVALTGTRFAGLQWRAHLDIVSFWNRFWPRLGCNAFNASPIYGDAVRIGTGFHEPGWPGVRRHLLTLAGYAPAIVPLPLLVFVAPSPPGWLLVWCLGTMTFAMLTLFVAPLKCLGTGHYYVFNAALPGSIWWAIALKGMDPTVLALHIAAVVATLAALVFGYIRRSKQRGMADADLQRAIAHLATLSPGRIAVFPLTAADAVAAATPHAVLWGGHGFGFQRLEPVFPVVSAPLAETFARHRLDSLLLDRRYWPQGMDRLSSEGVVGPGQDFGPWTVAPVLRTAAPVKILVVARSLGVGGAERHLLGVLPGLKDRGFAVEIAVLHQGGSLETAFSRAGIALHRIQRARGIVPSIGELRRLYRRLRPDIVHFVLPEAYLLGGLAALGLDGPALAMSRRSLNLYQGRHRLAALAERFLHRRMDALVGNSEAVLRELIAEGAPSDRLHLIPNGVLTAQSGDRNASRAQLGVTAAPLVLVIVGTLIPYKGHADLLEALSGIASRLPPGWRLVCAGRDTGIGPDLADQARKLGISENVLWLGERDDVADVLAASDIAVSASHEEGSPNAVIEAMAAGLPVVATAVGGSPELIMHGASGMLVPARNPSALGEAIAALAFDLDRRAVLGRNAFAHVSAKHRLETCVGAYGDLYARLAQQVRSDP